MPIKKKSNLGGLNNIYLSAFVVLVLSICIALYRHVPSPTDADDFLDEAAWSDDHVQKLHHEPSPQYCARLKDPLVCAHGGDTTVAPPNTIPAFQAAIAAGAGCLEVDVSMTKDKQLVVLHERDLAKLLKEPINEKVVAVFDDRRSRQTILPVVWRRLLNKPRNAPPPRIADLGWRQLQRLRWGTRQRIAQLSSVLSVAVQAGVAVTLDIKLAGRQPEEQEVQPMVRAVLAAMRQAGCGQACMVWAKTDAVALALKALDPGQRVGIVAFNATAEARGRGMGDISRLQGAGIDVVGAHYAMASVGAVAQAKAVGREFHVWTADTPAVMALALDAVPDAVVTSVPKRLLTAIEQRKNTCALHV